MKIFYLAPDINVSKHQSGGAGTHIRGTINYLKKNNELIECIGGDIIRKPAPSSTKAHPITSNLTKSIFKKLVPKVIIRLYHDIQRLKNNKAIRKIANEMIIKFEKPDIIYERSAYGYNVGLYLKKKYNIPYVLESDIFIVDFFKEFSSQIFNTLFFKNLEKQKITNADSIVVMSKESTHKIKSDWGLNTNNIFYKGLGADIIGNNIQNKLSIDKQFNTKNKFIFGYTGIFQSYHKIPVLLNAAQLVRDKNIIFMLIGNGDKIEDYKNLAKRLNLSNVIFTGLIDKKDIDAYYKRFDAGVIPGCAEHMYPVKFLEFYIKNIPTLVPAYNCFKEFFRQKNTFNLLTFIPNNAKDLAKKVEWVKQNFEQAKTESLHITQYILKNNTWDACGKRLEKILLQTINNKANKLKD